MRDRLNGRPVVPRPSSRTGILLIALCFSVGLRVTWGAPLQEGEKAPARVFRVGAATSNITPEIGGGIVGGFRPVPSTHIHDELHARCLMLDNGETQVALVVCDLLGGEQLMFDEARRLVTAETGLPGPNL